MLLPVLLRLFARLHVNRYVLMAAKSPDLADLTFRRYLDPVCWGVWGNSSTEGGQQKWAEVEFRGGVRRLAWPPIVDVDDIDPRVVDELDPLCDRPPMPPLRDVDADDSSDTVLESDIDEDEILGNLEFAEIELAKEGGACFHDIVLPSRIQRRVDVNNALRLRYGTAANLKRIRKHIKKFRTCLGKDRRKLRVVPNLPILTEAAVDYLGLMEAAFPVEAMLAAETD